jgi:hypothetical protein
MAMSTGGKIALGCGCLVLAAGAAAVTAVMGLGFWAKSKVADVTGGLDKMAAAVKEVDTWEQKAKAYAYSAPAGGLITEARLVKFLDTRKRVFAVYQQYEPQLKELEAKSKQHGDKPSFSDAMAGVGKVAELFNELRLTQMKALAENGMNPDEYRDIQMAVYKTAWAAESQKQSGRTPSEALTEAGQQMRDAMRKGLAEAQKQGVAIPEADAQQEKLEESQKELSAVAKSLEVPKANVELFRKYEADIKKYAMGGLVLIGL